MYLQMRSILQIVIVASATCSSGTCICRRKLPGDLLLEVGYVGTKGGKASIFANANTAPPGPGEVNPRRPHTNLGRYQLDDRHWQFHLSWHPVQS